MKQRLLLLSVLVLCTSATAWVEASNPKFAWTTELFLSEQQADGTAGAPGRLKGTPRQSRLIASPSTINGETYISCFIYLQDPTDLSALRALGVRVEKSFRGLNFITADVPVNKLEALAEIDNVTCIKVSPVAKQMTDVARQKTNVNDVLTNSSIAQLRGMSTTYDGSGVIVSVVDDGIDFGHIAFRNADGTSRIKRAYVYDGDTAILYTEAEINNPALAPTTDDIYEDHGTHCSAIAGGSSVIVNRIDNSHFNLSVTTAHDSATYGGMAPGADLYLAGVNGLIMSHLLTALALVAEYADSVGKPLVVSCSWGNDYGPRNSTGDVADVVRAYYGDAHPNHIILFAASNQSGNHDELGGGGTFVGKKNASRENPLRTIIRLGGQGGDYYPEGDLASAWSDSTLNGKLYVLDNDSGKIIWSREITKHGWSRIDSLPGYYPTAIVRANCGYDNSFESNKFVLCIENSPLMTDSAGAYSLAIEIYPENGTADINMWGYGQTTYFSNKLRHSTQNNPWQDGSDDNSICHEASIDDVIPVGAYTSKLRFKNYEGITYNYSMFTLDDIAYFSSYVTPEWSVTGQIAPWIAAPGFVVVSAGNHYHTAQVDDQSYYIYPQALIVNDSVNPYVSMQGTSQATPAAAGIVALWLQAAQSVGKSLTVSQVKDIMKRTAIHDYYTTDGPNASHFGYGKLDALAGIRLITGNNNSVMELPAIVCNDTTIAQHIDSTLNVLLTGHTLYKDNGCNTLCLPFDLDSAAMAASLLAGGKLMEMDSTLFSLNDTTLTLTFVRTNHVEAGKPYIIKWDSAENILQPFFTDVTISSTKPISVTSTDGNVVFQGTYNPIHISAYDTTILLVSAKNGLYLANRQMIFGSCSAYFKLSDNVALPKRLAFNLLDEPITTDLKRLAQEGVEKFWRNGQLYIRKDGVVYDVLGRKLSF